MVAIAFMIATSAPAQAPAPVSSATPKEASDFTRKANAAVLQQLKFADRRDFDDARRGFIATLSTPTITQANGHPAWSLTPYAFIKGDPPDTVNPSLWRIAELNLNHGLFNVTERVYQIRGFDLSNMTLIEGDTGLIVIDPLITVETAKAGLDLYYQHRPRKPVVAVIYTHSHADHYGGVKGVVNEADVKAGRVAILAPEGFLEEAVAENVFAGNAMNRRALYQYGALLPRNARGQVDAGLGKTTSFGTFTLIAPTDIVSKTGETRTVDGVQMEFLMAPHTEAPAEFLIWFPQFKMLNSAEDATHTLHNLYTLRGVEVRDATAWWKTLQAALERYDTQVEVLIAQHHWPVWGRERIVQFLADQRDQLKYIHDQTLNLANKGYTSIEIAEMLKVPASISSQWYNRGYYGSVSHNAKAVYQRYLGWYDSNPANLYPLPPEEVAKKYVAAMGGADAILQQAKISFDAGDYRWVAEQLKHVVFADPQNQAARNLQADALEQLAYQTENPTWRNEFLMGAYELRNGVRKLSGVSTVTDDVIQAMSEDLILGYAGIRLNGPEAEGKTLRLNWKQPNGKVHTVELRNSVLIYSEGRQFVEADATLTVDKVHLAAILMGATSLEKEMAHDRVQVSGNKAKVIELFSLLDTFPLMFDVVTP